MRVWRYLWQQARANPLLTAGLIIVGPIVILSVIAPLVFEQSPTDSDFDSILVGPSREHFFGTDDSGFDIFTRVIYAPRVDLFIALAATAISASIGVPIGLAAGFFSGWRGVRGVASSGVMRMMDIFQAFPVFILALALVAGAGRSMTNVIIAIAFVNIPVFVRLTRAEALRVRERAHVDAAFLVGNSRFRIARRHILPLSVGPALVQFSPTAGFAIVMTAGLGFIGAGVRPPTPEWGVMIANGAGSVILGHWWASLFPGVFLAVTVLGLAFIGDGIGRMLARV